MAPPDEVALYKIDYTTTLAQPDSKLCTMPYEILEEIAKGVISKGAFSLRNQYDQLKSDIPADHQLQDASLSVRSKFSTEDMGLLRSCKAIRRKLLPLLVKLTDFTTTVWTSPFDTYMGVRLSGSYSGPQTTQIQLPHPFRAKLRRLAFYGRPLLMPDPACLANLEEIHVNGRDWIVLTDRDIWDDNASLVRACQSRLTRSPTPACDAWVLTMVDRLKAQELLGKIHVTVSLHVFYQDVQNPLRSGRLGKALYDITAGTVKGKSRGRGGW